MALRKRWVMEGITDELVDRALGLVHQMQTLEDELTELLSFMTEEERYNFIDDMYAILEGVNHE